MAVSTKNSAPTAGTYGIVSGNSASYMMPNCTWFAFYRAHDEFGTFPVTNMVNANLGLDYVNREGGGEEKYDSNGVAGDVLVYGNNHVAFVEGDGMISESAGTEGYQDTSGNKITLDRSKNALNFYNQVLAPNWSRPAYNSAGTGTSGTVSSRFGRKQYSTVYGSNYLGRLHQKSNSGGGGHDGGGGEQPTSGGVKDATDPTGDYTRTERLCGEPLDGGSQMGPKVPTIYDQEQEDLQKKETETGGEVHHGRTNRRGTSFWAYTYERYLKYELDSEGNYVGVGSDGEFKTKKEHSGAIAGYETAIQGPLEGGDFDGSDGHEHHYPPY